MLRRVYLLNDGPLSAITGVYVDGTEVVMASAVYGGADGLVMWADPDALDPEITALQSRLEALGWSEGLGPRTVAERFGQHIVAEAARLAGLKAKREGARVVHRIGQPVGGTEDPVELTSTINVFTDLGGAGVSAADLRLSETIGSAGLRSADPPTDYSWDGTADQLQGAAWVMVETYSFRDGPEWGGAPSMQFVCESGLLDGAYTDNPASVIHWLLTERMEVPEDDVVGVAAATAVCAQAVEVNDVAMGTEDAGNDFTLTELLAYLFAAGVPSNAILGLVLAEWNRRYAGASNSAPRWQCHGVITSRMLASPDTLLAQLGRAMGGWVARTGNAYRLVPGTPTPVTRTITDEDMASIGSQVRYPVWVTSVPTERRINRLSGSLVQDAAADYQETTLPDVEDALLLSDDGYRSHDLGTLPFQANQEAAARLMNIELKRAAPNLLPGDIRLARGDAWANFAIQAGDRIRLTLERELIDAIFFVQKVDPDFDSETVRLVVREDPDAIYGVAIPLPKERQQVVPTTFAGAPLVLGAAAPPEIRFDDVRRYEFAGILTYRVVAIENARIVPADGFTLVFRIDAGAWTKATVGGDIAGDGVIIQAGNDGAVNIIAVIPAPGSPSKFITLAARAGAGTMDSPYDYTARENISVPTELRPEDMVLLVSRRSGGRHGTAAKLNHHMGGIMRSTNRVVVEVLRPDGRRTVHHGHNTFRADGVRQYALAFAGGTNLNAAVLDVRANGDQNTAITGMTALALQSDPAIALAPPNGDQQLRLKWQFTATQDFAQSSPVRPVGGFRATRKRLVHASHGQLVTVHRGCHNRRDLHDHLDHGMDRGWTVRPRTTTCSVSGDALGITDSQLGTAPQGIVGTRMGGIAETGGSEVHDGWNSITYELARLSTAYLAVTEDRNSDYANAGVGDFSTGGSIDNVPITATADGFQLGDMIVPALDGDGSNGRARWAAAFLEPITTGQSRAPDRH